MSRWLSACVLVSLITIGLSSCGGIPASDLSQLSVSASQFPGTDIGAKANAAFAALPNGGTVLISPGTYSYSATINVPVVDHGRYRLKCDDQTVLHYTGKSYGVSMVGWQGMIDTVVEGCNVIGTSSGLAGFYTKAFSGAKFINISVSGFTNGDGFLNAGANTIEISPKSFFGNKVGLHQVGSTYAGQNFAPNAVRVTGGVFQNNSQWGIYEDAANLPASSPGQGNVYSTTFENNGTPGNFSTGNMWIQSGEATIVDGSYLEQLAGSPVNLRLGDASHTVKSPTIRNNFFYTGSTSATASIDNKNSTEAAIENNIDNSILSGSVYLPQMILQGTDAVGTRVVNNRMSNINLTNQLVGYVAGAPALGSYKNAAFGPAGSFGSSGDSLPSQAFTGVSEVDGNVMERKMLYLTTTAAPISQQSFTPSSRWRIIFLGTWMNSYDATVLAQPATYIEVKSASPILALGNITVTFAQNGTGQIVAATNRATAAFLGSMFILGDSLNAGGSESMRVPSMGVFGGGIQPAESAGPITWFKKQDHFSLPVAPVPSGTCSAAMIETIIGAAPGDSCSVSSATGTADGSYYACNVTAPDTVKWSYCNLSGSPHSRASDTYTIRVLR